MRLCLLLGTHPTAYDRINDHGFAVVNRKLYQKVDIARPRVHIRYHKKLSDDECQEIMKWTSRSNNAAENESNQSNELLEKIAGKVAEFDEKEFRSSADQTIDSTEMDQTTFHNAIQAAIKMIPPATASIWTVTGHLTEHLLTTFQKAHLTNVQTHIKFIHGHPKTTDPQRKPSIFDANYDLNNDNTTTVSAAATASSPPLPPLTSSDISPNVKKYLSSNSLSLSLVQAAAMTAAPSSLDNDQHVPLTLISCTMSAQYCVAIYPTLLVPVMAEWQMTKDSIRLNDKPWSFKYSTAMKKRAGTANKSESVVDGDIALSSGRECSLENVLMDDLTTLQQFCIPQRSNMRAASDTTLTSAVSIGDANDLCRLSDVNIRVDALQREFESSLDVTFARRSASGAVKQCRRDGQ